MAESAGLEFRDDGRLSTSDLGGVVQHLQQGLRTAAAVPRALFDSYLASWGIHRPSRQQVVHFFYDLGEAVQRMRDKYPRTMNVVEDLLWIGTFSLYRWGGDDAQREGTSSLNGNPINNEHMAPIPPYMPIANGIPTKKTGIGTNPMSPQQTLNEVDIILRLAGYEGARLGAEIREKQEILGTLNLVNGVVTTSNQVFYNAVSDALTQLGYKIKIELVTKN